MDTQRSAESPVPKKADGKAVGKSSMFPTRPPLATQALPLNLLELRTLEAALRFWRQARQSGSTCQLRSAIRQFEILATLQGVPMSSTELDQLQLKLVQTRTPLVPLYESDPPAIRPEPFPPLAG